MATEMVRDTSSMSIASELRDPLNFEIVVFTAYLLQLLPLLLGATERDLNRMFQSTEYQEIISKWANDVTAPAVYITKMRVEVELDAPELNTYHVSSNVKHDNRNVVTLSLIKHSTLIDTTLAISDQLHFLNLFGPAAGRSIVGATAGSGVYEGLHRLVHLGITPAFDAFIESTNKKDVTKRREDLKDDSKMGIPMTKKKFAELELSLLHLQQNVEIPEIILNIHPAVQAAISTAKEQGITPTVALINSTLLTDTTFLNRLQSDVNNWVKEIRTVTNLNRDVSSGTASQEINFWLSMERALDGIEEQLKNDSVVLSLEILRSAKRFHATTTFTADTGLKEAMETVHKYNVLMKDFPLDELLAATDLTRVQESIQSVFNHFIKKMKISPYPVRRALDLVSAISRALNDQLLKVLGVSNIMSLEYSTFATAMQGCSTIYSIWDECVKEFTNIARDITRKRGEKFISMKIDIFHNKLQSRLEYLNNFRDQHHQLQSKVSSLSAKGVGEGALGIDMNREVRQAYDSVKDVEVLEVGAAGTEVWVQAEAVYIEKVARVENQIISRLREQLGAARNANEMFRVFSKFKALLARQKIKGAVVEYQDQLLESVKTDINLLHAKYTEGYHNSEAYRISQLRDYPPVSGAIIWAQQIESQLEMYMKRVEAVLGEGWRGYAEGAKLCDSSEKFKVKLETKEVFNAWIAETSKRKFGIVGPIFNITKNRSQGGALQLVINFDSQTIALFKEVRNLIWRGFAVPNSILSISKDAKKVYPYAVNSIETVRTYTQTVAKVNANPGIVPLISDLHVKVQMQIKKCMPIRWEQFTGIYDPRKPEATASRSIALVSDLAKAVSAFQDTTDSLIDTYSEIMVTIERLATCPYTSSDFSTLLGSIQTIIDNFNLIGFSNLSSWVAELDKQIEAVLVIRLRSAMELWCVEFAKDGETTTEPKRIVTETEGMVFKTLLHEIRIKNQVIYLEPPIEQARGCWYQQLHSSLAVICGLKRVQAARYENSMRVRKPLLVEDRDYTALLDQFVDGTLTRPLALIENKLDQITAYVGKWLQFQSLWDLEAEYVYNRLGDSLSSWQQLLMEIQKTRATFDNSENEKSFGVAIINYDQVQSKVTAKYDTWQREILGRFGSKLSDKMKETYETILESRHKLESHSIDASTTNATVDFIELVQTLNRNVKKWSPEIQLFGYGQTTLERQRYQFPINWLTVERIESEWSTFNVILGRRNASIQESLASLQTKILAEDQVIQNRIEEIVENWNLNKPMKGDVKPEAAMKTVVTFESKVHQLKQEADAISRAKEALNLELVHDTRLTPVIEEIKDIKEVWTVLDGVWKQIGELKETLWSIVQSRKLRTQLDDISKGLQSMTARLRNYAAFVYVGGVIKDYLKSNLLVGDLKSEALRERHWRQLFKVIRVDYTYTASSLTLGAVWNLDLQKNQKPIQEVILQAQGEMALEEFIKQVKETWTGYSLDLVNYQTKTRLIRGWEDLFTKCSENLSSLSAMKLSPYYKVFEEEASSWEDKLNRVHVLFDVWIDVQRQWVYLEGIFSGSADIKHLLPVESQRFNNINAEFLNVMKKVAKSPLILDVLNIQGVQKSLERLADLLSKIQKALGEYLERERASFPRFYFVGDEDLLEIIGNSKDILRIGKFLKKMFAGLASISLDKDLTQIQGMASREGEMVTFSNPIILKDYAKINDWLTKLELEMKVSLAQLLATAFLDLQQFYNAVEGLDSSKFLSWIQLYPAQLVVLAVQIGWTSLVEGALASNKSLEGPLSIVLRGLELLADAVLSDLEPIQRRKCEHLITELVHERDVIRSLIQQNVDSNTDFNWLYQMRFYLDSSILNPLDQLQVRMASANFSYGYEYLGVPDRLVQTPLTDRCYLTLTQALHSRLGGSPFGPAGTGKTESVKALGVQLGRFVLVFCCDETFDFQAMGRIFVGLCQVGAWGCFDEFNRLEERILSAVSQQIQSIQLGLSARVTNPEAKIELVGRQLRISQDTGIFITMNPGYAGRSNLPDNLKKLFRSIAMTRPDRELIAQVMLFSQGFRTAETLASKIVPFFNLCSEQLSSQPHYDFGLRALKSVLVSAGHLKRERLQLEIIPGTVIESVEISEQEILIQSVTETIVPKLVANDVPLLTSLLSDVFPGINYVPVNLDELRKHIIDVSVERQLVPDAIWLQKVIQLYQIQNIQHGLMMVGPSATGKTTAWSVLLTALERLSGIEGVSYVIDPKAISKEALYGTLDSTTREWNDGLFTHILRKIVDDVRSESMKRHWIIFDGDVDPEWVENLNSVLDDNKLLTLPNGERLNLPSNVRIMFEVESLKYATLATVSRCGMVWFSEDAISPSMLYKNYLQTITALPLDATDDDLSIEVGSDKVSTNLAIQRTVATRVEQYFEDGGLIPQALEFAAGQDHIMDFTIIRAVTTLFSLLNKTIRNVVEFNTQHADFPMPFEKIESYVTKRLLVAIVWAFTGDSKLETRAVMGDFLRDHSGIDLPPLTAGASLIDYDVAISTGDWISWQSSVPTIEIETHTVLSADVVIPTMDTARHEEVLYSWLSEHRPLLLCGPPGSGKTMTLFSALRKLPDLEVIGLNFSSATTPELILKTFEQHCEYRKTPSGVILSPVQIGKWIVLFCDEINLPATDTYGTQKVISFLRQLVEHGGYWRVSDKSWVKLERIQFVGACNPPTDPGRVALSHRFLRHAPLVMVDYPGETSLNQIYGTFNRAVLKVVPSLRDFSRPLTSAMVEFYLTSQKRFTTDIQAHYVYSPRELTRWMRGIYEAIKPLDNLAVEGLVRIWAHEALRLFQDRLVTEEERKVTDEMIDEVALKHFPAIDPIEALARPILYSNWTSKDYLPVGREELRDFTKARLRTFYEEELDVPLVLFDDVLEHVLRIDRVFKQVQGHLLLIGVSGSGKTTLSRFVAWMNGLSVFQIKVHNKYSAEDFDDDLRAVLRRAGCKGEKIAFILDESNVLDSGFLERMNTLLANAEVPGLFEGDEHAALMTACKEGAQRDGLMLDSQEELYRWFTQQVSRNLHVVFTMNPPSGGLASRAATSPALFNRCVLDWFGDWSDQAFYQVGMEFTNSLDLDTANYIPPSNFPVSFRQLSLPPSHRSAVINGLVNVHMSMYETNAKLARRQGRTNFVTPRHYLDFINQYVKIFNEKRDELEEQQRHLNVGLEKLRTTVIQVEELRVSLASKGIELDAKNAEANEKLIRMVQDQQIAEQKKLDSIKIQADLETQKVIIEARSAIVIADLAAAAPAVEDAQAAVRNIKKQQLTEVRSMANPPEAVKLAMESVCTILGNKIESWKTVQSIIRQEGFIASIVNFDTQSMSSALRDKMQQEYLSLPNFNFENVNRASKACGPLCIWVIAQVNYSNILERIGPLREEVEQLEREAGETEDKATHMITMVAELEARIAQFKGEYALLISETQAIKAEVERVEKRVTRSITLLESLGSERIRWEAGSKTFESQMSTVAGDVLLSAAFLAYSGYFDQQYRESMWQSWSDHLSDAGIQFKPELSLSEYLSTAEDRLEWQSKSLPADDLCTENAIMLERFDRYPLIIDPSGQATAFLLNKYKQKKISVTSFLDEAFLKNLESALRFGTPLLVQDVENLDPILNAVLNKELRRAGGRVLIRLGNQDIDFSPAFTMFLTTRDPSVDFPADLISRVTMVNFSITRASLQAQSLSQVLRVERPDTDRKRSDLLRLQGEFRARLHVLEKSLLSALNESHGNILDDDKVIETLETLKREAAEITQKVEETDSVMAEVEQVTSEYLPLAQACSSIFFVLDELHLLNHFYQFSLRFFLDIFDFVLLHNPSLLGVTNSTTRLSILLEDLFLHVFKRTSRALLHSDHLTLAMLLAQVKLRAGIDEVEYNFLLEGGEIAGTKAESNLRILDLNQNNRLEAFKRLECFSTLEAHIQGHPDEWSRFLTSKCPESELPPIWTEISPASLALRTVLVIRCLRPDRLLPAVGGFVNFAFGRDLLSESTYELSKMVANEVTANSPIALCSVPGYDASYRVDALVAATNSKCTSVAMGSQEGETLADQAIAAAARTGNWVLLKNVHLAPSWLSQLEKRLQSLKTLPNFRLFLTMETNPSIPINILRQSRVLLNEPPPGIRANMLESLKSISPARIASGPMEKTRIYFLLAWFHALVQERLRYVPLGWSKPYEFNDSDQEAALGTIDSWLIIAARGRSNIDPASIPWDAIRSLMRESIYGGKIDTEVDQILLDSFVGNLFSARSYDIDFYLVPKSQGEVGLLMPDATKIDEFITWTKNLPESEPPSYLSLPATAETIISVAQGSALLARLLRMRALDDDMETVSVEIKGSGADLPLYMRLLGKSCSEWLNLLPEAVPALTNEGRDSLSRFFEREVEVARATLAIVRNDLQKLKLVCEGKLKQTNSSRNLLSDLNKAMVPSHWQTYQCQPLSVGIWIQQFAQRVQMERIVGKPVHLGLLFNSGGFITATRQLVAHTAGISLELLHLSVGLEKLSSDANSFNVQGLSLVGATWLHDRLVLNDGSTTQLGISSISWSKISTEIPRAVRLPCWLDSTRSELLLTVQVDGGEVSAVDLVTRGLAIVL